MGIDTLAWWRDRPNPLVTMVIGGPLLAATVWVARRLTRDAAVK